MIELLWFVTCRPKKPYGNFYDTQTLVFSARNRREALRAANRHAELRWKRGRYEILDCRPVVNGSTD